MITIDDNIIVDAALTETLSYNTRVTEFPIESGAKVADHVTNDPLQLQLSCYVSDAPIGVVASERGGDKPSKVVYQQLLALRDARKTTTIFTGFRDYASMVLTSLSIPITVEDGLTFDAVFTEVLTISVAQQQATVELPRLKSKANLQNKPSEEQPFVPVDRRSAAQQTRDWIAEKTGIGTKPRRKLTAKDFDRSVRDTASKKVH